jgi:hypothetical protein
MSNTSEGLSHILVGSVSDSEEDTVFFDDLDEDNPKDEISAQPMIFFGNPHQVPDEESPASSYGTGTTIDGSTNGSSKSHQQVKAIGGQTSPDLDMKTRDIAQQAPQYPDSPKGNSTLVIEHSMASSTPTAAAFLLGMSKPVFAFVALALLLTTASAVVFFTQFLRIPGLDNQIVALTAQVDRLESQLVELQNEIDRLSTEVDRLGSEVDSLSLENDRLASENDRLQVENTAFDELNQKFNGTNADFVELLQSLSNTSDNLLLQVTQLTIETASLKNSTGSLEMQVVDLQDEANTLNTTNSELNATNQILETQNVKLNSDIILLNGTNNALMTQNKNLNASLMTLDQRNTDLTEQVDRLESVVGFLNETTNNGTFEELIQTLSSLIETNRNLVLTSLQTQYLARVDNWLCDFLSAFAGKTFIENPDLGIGASDYPSVISNVNLVAMAPLCLDTDNFEDFVTLEFPSSHDGTSSPYNVTANQLRSAVAQYTSQALTYYFPGQGEVGVSPQNWTQARYDCEGLPSSLKFAIDLN